MVRRWSANKRYYFASNFDLIVSHDPTIYRDFELILIVGVIMLSGAQHTSWNTKTSNKLAF